MRIISSKIAPCSASVEASFGEGARKPTIGFVTIERAIYDFLASLIFDRLFTRFPGVRVASVENGSDWIHLLVKRLRKQANQTPWAFQEDPLETLRRQRRLARDPRRRHAAPRP